CCFLSLPFLFFLLLPPPTPTLFPYTTLFRSLSHLLACPRIRPFRRQPARPENFQRRQARIEFLASPQFERHLSLPHLDQFGDRRSEEHTSELQSLRHLVCRLLLEKKKKKNTY